MVGPSESGPSPHEPLHEDLLALLPEETQSLIPEHCRECPVLLTRLAVSKTMADGYDNARESTNNPINKASAMISKWLSRVKVNGDVRARLPAMADCDGVVLYPVDSEVQVGMCGLTYREQVAPRIREQQ